MEVESMKNLRLNEICRICLSSGKKELRPLFADMIVDMLTDCVRIQVEKIEGWPDKICTQCVNQVSRFHSFKQRAEKMDQTLREYIKGLTVIVEEQVPAEITLRNIELPAHHIAPGQPFLATTTNGQVLATAFGQPLQIQSNGQIIPVQVLPNGQAQLVQIQQPQQQHTEHIHHQQSNDLNAYQQTQYYEEEMILDKEGHEEELGEEEEEEIVENYIIEEIDEEELEAIEVEKSHENNPLIDAFEDMEDPDDELDDQLDDNTEGDIEIVIEEDVQVTASPKVIMPPHTKKCSNHVPIPVSMAEMGDPEDKEFMAQFISLQTSCPAPGRHVCNLCHKEYKLIHSLHNHMKSHSNWIKANCKRQPECDICHKKFKGPGMLKMHMKTHAERSLQCEYCKKAFQTEYHLGLHLVKHNNKTAESFKCDPCNQSFISSNDLRLHKRRCHSKFTQNNGSSGHREDQQAMEMTGTSVKSS